MTSWAMIGLLALLGSRQDPPSPDWRELNSVDLIVNEECLTRQDVHLAVRRRGGASSAEEFERNVGQVIGERITALLKAQAGKDMAFDEDMVRGFVQNYNDQRLERAGSVSVMADLLKGTEYDSASFYEDSESRVLAELWTRSKTGRGPGPTGRNYVDRFVRPGRLGLEFERRKPPAMIVLQQISSLPEGPGSLEAAAALAQECLDRIRGGEDFGAVAEETKTCPPGTGGVNSPREEDLLRQIPGIGGFLATASTGDVSEVLPIRVGGALRGYRVVKMLERREVASSFRDHEVQERIRQRILQDLDRRHEGEGVQGLLEAAYVWPPEAFGRAPEAGMEAPPAVPGPSGQGTR